MKTTKTLILLLLLIACEERYETQFDLTSTGLLAVEAVLTNENVSQKVRLTFPYQQLNGNPVPATGAVVRVMDGNSTLYTFTEDPSRPGEYYSTPFRAVFGVTYTLHIQLNNKDYFAQDSSVPVGPLEPLAYRPVDTQFELILNETGSDPYYIDHQISWLNTSSCTTASCTGRVVFYDLKSIDVNEIYKPGKKQFLFPGGSTVIRRKYSVSSGYRTYLRSMLSETEWRGSVFDVDRANTATNLSSGATGFFAVTTVVADTTLIP